MEHSKDTDDGIIEEVGLSHFLRNKIPINLIKSNILKMANKKKVLKNYLISSVITFLTGFIVVILASIDNVTLESFKNGTIMGLFFTAIRMGVKSLMEYFLIESSK